MGNTYRKNPSRFDNDGSVWRTEKHPKHSSDRKQDILKTLNSYVEEDYEDTFDLDEDLGYTNTSKHTKTS
jgi:hypothetical protein|tara:strand:+ start:2964 stop:3173 length:210 start_codon:yes stop_codon:yes gene_type:complete